MDYKAQLDSRYKYCTEQLKLESSTDYRHSQRVEGGLFWLRRPAETSVIGSTESTDKWDVATVTSECYRQSQQDALNRLVVGQHSFDRKESSRRY